jgi:phage gp45-like
MQRSMTMTMVLGTALKSKDNQAAQGMQIRLSAYQVRDNVPMFGLHGVVSRPLPGAQVAVVMDRDNPSIALGIAVNDPRHYRGDLPDGTVGLGHHLGGAVLLLNDGTIVSSVTGETLRKLVTDVFVELFNKHTHSTPSGMSQPPSQQMTAAHLTGATRAGGP